MSRKRHGDAQNLSCLIASNALSANVDLHAGWTMERHVQEGPIYNSHQTIHLASTMLASLALLLGNLGGNVVTLRVNMVMVCAGRARNPNVQRFAAALKLKPLADKANEDHGNQQQQ